MNYYEELNNRLIDEYNDVITYMNLYMTATDGNNCIFKDIANEERTHAELIKNILIEANQLNDPDNVLKLQKEADELLLKKLERGD